ncbi:hypothetical protein KKC22_18945 [Myxococcota bacterium]|nr:hypothetical protein [Myxococcota bacterium]
MGTPLGSRILRGSARTFARCVQAPADPSRNVQPTPGARQEDCVRANTTHERGNPTHERANTTHGRGNPTHERANTTHGRGNPTHGRGNTTHDRGNPTHGRADLKNE